ncbi:MAG: rod shape-determining protein MreC [Bacteroidota bacterium]|nr:rod shape-determining protein MreC [Bacteroidota bacterium]
MQRILDFILKFKEWIVFTMLVIISLSMISMGDVNRIGGFRSLVIGSIGWLQELFSWIPNPAALKSENRALRELNYQLSKEVIRMRQSMIENLRLRSLMNLTQKIDYQVLSAEIIGRTVIEMRNYQTLDKGGSDSIIDGMTVQTDAGLVGVIAAHTDNISLVETILNRQVKIAAKIERTGINGIVAWEGGDFLIMNNIPESYDVKKGDVVITSSNSNKFHKDIPIGRIEKIERGGGSLFLKINIKPFVDFLTVEQVFIVKELPNPERQRLIKEMESRLKLIKK